MNTIEFTTEYMADIKTILENIKDDKIRDIVDEAIKRNALKEIAEKYSEVENDIDKRTDKLFKQYPLAKEALGKLYYLIDKNVVEYAFDLICDIEEAIYDKAYDDGWDEGIQEHKKGEPDLVVDTQKGYKDSSYYRPICKKGEEEIVKLKEKISANENFIEFIKAELPEPYKLLLKEYRKRGEKLYE